MYHLPTPVVSTMPPYMVITFLLGLIGYLVLSRGDSRFNSARKTKRGYPKRKQSMFAGFVFMCIGLVIFFCAYLELMELLTMWHPVLTLGQKPQGLQ